MSRKKSRLRGKILIMLCLFMVTTFAIPSISENIYAKDTGNQTEEKQDVQKEDEASNEEVKNEETNKNNSEEAKNDVENYLSEDVKKESTSETEKPVKPENGEQPARGRAARAYLIIDFNVATMNQAATGAIENDGTYRYSLYTDRATSETKAVIEEYVGTQKNDITIVNTLGGAPVGGIRKNAFRNKALTGGLYGITSNAHVFLLKRVIGDYAFADNKITMANNFALAMEAGCSGKGILMSNKLTFIDTSHFDYSKNYEIPPLTFANNEITSVVLSTVTGSSLKQIGVMAFANNKISSITGLQDAVTIYSGAFYNNQVTTNVINDFPTNVTFATGTTDPFGGDSAILDEAGNRDPLNEGLGAFQKNRLAQVPTVKTGWKFGYHTFMDNQITNITYNLALMKASADSIGLFAANPLVSFTCNFGGETIDASLYGVPKEFVAAVTKNNTQFRNAPKYEMLKGFDLSYNPSLPGAYFLSTIREGAFRGTKIKAIGMLVSVGVIEEQAFAYCDELISTNKDTTFSSTYSIGKQAFYKCPKLSGGLYFPVVIDISEGAFAMSDNVTDNRDPSITNGRISAIEFSLPLSFFHPSSLTKTSIGKGAFAYQGFSGQVQFLTNVIIFGEYSFAHNSIVNLYISYLYNDMASGNEAVFGSKSFIGNKILFINPTKYGIRSIASDAFANQNIDGRYVDRTITLGGTVSKYSMDVTDLSNMYSFGLTTIDKTKFSKFLDGNGNQIAASDAEFIWKIGGSTRNIFQFNSKPAGQKFTSNYSLRNPDGDTFGGGQVVTNFTNLKYRYQTYYTIGNLNKDKAGFGNTSTKQFYEMIEEGVAPSTALRDVVTLPGYSVEGWYNNAGCTGEQVDINASRSDPILLYAKIVKSHDVTFDSGPNAEFGTIGSGIRKKVLKVPEGSTVAIVMDRMTQAQKDEWKLAYDTSPTTAIKRKGEWFTSNDFLPGFTDTTVVPNQYILETIVDDTSPKSLYADVDNFKELLFLGGGIYVEGGPSFAYGEFGFRGSGIRERRMDVRYGKAPKLVFSGMTTEEKNAWKVVSRSDDQEVITNMTREWKYQDVHGMYEWTDLMSDVMTDSPSVYHATVLYKIGEATLHSGNYAEFGSLGSNKRTLSYTLYEGTSLETALQISVGNGSVSFNDLELSYDHSKYEQLSYLYTSPDFATTINTDETFVDAVDIDAYYRLKLLNIDTELIPDPDNPANPNWGVKVPSEIILQKDREVAVDTSIVSLTGYDESISNGLNVDLYLRSANGMKLKRNGSTEELKYKILFNTTTIEGTNESLIGTFNSGNRMINGTARVLEDGIVLDTYRDNITFRIAKRMLP